MRMAREEEEDASTRVQLREDSPLQLVQCPCDGRRFAVCGCAAPAAVWADCAVLLVLGSAPAGVLPVLHCAVLYCLSHSYSHSQHSSCNVGRVTVGSVHKLCV